MYSICSIDHSQHLKCHEATKISGHQGHQQVCTVVETCAADNRKIQCTWCTSNNMFRMVSFAISLSAIRSIAVTDPAPFAGYEGGGQNLCLDQL